jgi:hypothetical protein
MLTDDFVLGFKNIERAPFVGSSLGYARNRAAVETTNGAGAHNVQVFVLSADLVVLHALPGYWRSEDLARELSLAKAMHRLWRDDTRTRAQKDQLWTRMHLSEPTLQGEETARRSAWQSFDAFHERHRAQGCDRDTFLVPPGEGVTEIRLKPINVLVHERLARRPFVPFAEFDVEQFLDYGQRHYDNNAGIDRKGRSFGRARR